MEIRFVAGLADAEKYGITKAWECFMKRLGDKITPETIVIDPGSVIEVNYACIWNKIKDIGKKGVVLASDNKFCVVILVGKPFPDIYRCEDVTFLRMPTEKAIVDMVENQINNGDYV